MIKTSNITLTMPAEPRQLDPCPISVAANYPDGSTMKGAHVSVALTMPSMSMPANQVALKETSPGVFSGSCRFTMAGTWKVRVLLVSPEYSRSDRWVQVTVH